MKEIEKMSEAQRLKCAYEKKSGKLFVDGKRDGVYVDLNDDKKLNIEDYWLRRLSRQFERTRLLRR
jgi:hypothetical protein